MPNIEFKFNLGDKVQDKVTNLTGIIMCMSKYSTGCKHYAIQQQLVSKEGKTPDWEHFDESRIILIEAGAVNLQVEEPTSGPTALSHYPPQ